MTKRPLVLLPAATLLAALIMFSFCALANAGVPAKSAQVRPPMSWTLDNTVTTGTASCFGLGDKACPKSAEGEEKGCKALTENGEVCDLVKKSCEEMYCTPFCLRDTFKAEVTGFEPFLFAPASGRDRSDMAVQTALSLRAQVMGYACETAFECCAKGEYVKTWVEDMSYKAKGGPMTLLSSLPGCHAPHQDPVKQEELCKQCKSGVKVKLKKKNCHEYAKFALTGFSKGSSADPKLGGEDLAKEQQPARRRLLHAGRSRMTTLQVMRHFMKSVWIHKRCMEAMDKMAAKFSKVQGDMESGRLCACMGCCIPDIEKDPDADCPYPLAIDA